MKTTIEALQNTYVKLGGTASDVADIVTIPDMIDAINTLVDAGGSGGVMFVTLTRDANSLYTVNKTYDEMVAAYQAGKLLVLDDGSSLEPGSLDAKYPLYLNEVNTTSGYELVVFSNIYGSMNYDAITKLDVVVVLISKTNVVTYKTASANLS